MVKIVTFFLIAMAVLAMFGRLRLPRITRKNDPSGMPKPTLCKECGRYSLKGGHCAHCQASEGG